MSTEITIVTPATATDLALVKATAKGKGDKATAKVAAANNPSDRLRFNLPGRWAKPGTTPNRYFIIPLPASAYRVAPKECNLWLINPPASDISAAGFALVTRNRLSKLNEDWVAKNTTLVG